MPKQGFILPTEGVDRIRSRLRELGLSQEVIANELKVDERTVRNWLANKTILPENLEMLLARLGIGVEEVFGDQLPDQYREQKTLSRLIHNIREMIRNGEIQRLIEIYRPFVEALFQHVSFFKIPPRGPFVMLEHDGTHTKRYAHVVVKTTEYQECARYILSFQFYQIARVNIGEIIVDQEQVTAHPFFQKYSHTIARKSGKEIHFAMWFDLAPCLFFVEATDGKWFEARVKNILDEKAMSQKENEIAVFWKGVWH